MRKVVLPWVLAIGMFAAGCSDSGDRKVSEPCDLLTESDAALVLGSEVERVGLVEVVEAEEGPLPEDERALAEDAARRNCVYRRDGGQGYLALQLDLHLFTSVEEFTSAFVDVELVDRIGVAANYGASGERQEAAVNVLLNDAGDSFALASYDVGTTRETLLDLAADLADRYGD